MNVRITMEDVKCTVLILMVHITVAVMKATMLAITIHVKVMMIYFMTGTWHLHQPVHF